MCLLSLTGARAAVIDSLLITPSLDEKVFRNGTLDISYAAARGTSVAYTLLDADGNVVAKGSAPKEAKAPNEAQTAGRGHLAVTLDSVRRWTAETPYLYTLRLTATPRKGEAVTVSRRVGFRLVAIRYSKLYLNGCPLFIKGVGMHGAKPGMSRAEMAATVRLLKAYGMNAVYTDIADPAWYELCDEQGLYVCADLARRQTMQAAEALYNHPSVVMWNIGDTKTADAATLPLLAALKAIDTQRAVVWAGLAPDRVQSDIYFPCGPSPKEVDEFCRTKRPTSDKPVVIANCGSAPGNSYGALAEYMMRYKSSRFAGLFLCDGTLQAMQAHMPAMEEVRSLMQDISISSHAPRVGRVVLSNDTYYTRFDNMHVLWAVRHNGEVVKSGTCEAGSIEPQKHRAVRLGYDDLYKTWPEGELTLDIACVRGTAALPQGAAAMPYATVAAMLPGDVLATAQFVARPHRDDTAMQPAPVDGKARLKVRGDSRSLTVAGPHCTVTFDKATGWLTRYTAAGRDMLAGGGTLKPCFSRLSTDNDRAAGADMTLAPWGDDAFALTSLKAEKVKNDSTMRRDIRVTACYDVPSRKLGLVLCYTIDGDGNIKVSQTVTPQDGAAACEVQRMGMVMTVPVAMDSTAYWGLGPLENYADRRTAATAGVWHIAAADAACPYTPVQEWGNRGDVRWWRQTDKQGHGLELAAPVLFAASAQRTGGAGIDLHIDLCQAGMSEWTHRDRYAETFEDTRVFLRGQTFTFWIKPL